MHTNIHIRIKDAVFLKRWVFNTIMPIGQKAAEIQLEGRPLPLHLKLLTILAHLLLFRSLKNQLGLSALHLR